MKSIPEFWKPPTSVVFTSNSDNISLYGNGVFTTSSFYDSELFLWEKHWKRLTANAAQLGIDISAYAERNVKDTVSKAIEENRSANGRVRMTFLDESCPELWGGDGEKKTVLSIVIGDRRRVPNEFRLAILPHRVNTTSPLAGIKSCNYLEPLMVFDEAKNRGFDEAIRLNERGDVASACMANVFWSNGGKLYTPSLKTGCLAGTTREFILENLECEEVEAGEEAIREADEIFLTSAGIGVVQVAEFDGRAMNRDRHKILSLLPKPL